MIKSVKRLRQRSALYVNKQSNYQNSECMILGAQDQIIDAKNAISVLPRPKRKNMMLLSISRSFVNTVPFQLRNSNMVNIMRYVPWNLRLVIFVKKQLTWLIGKITIKNVAQRLTNATRVRIMLNLWTVKSMINLEDVKLLLNEKRKRRNKNKWKNTIGFTEKKSKRIWKNKKKKRRRPLEGKINNRMNLCKENKWSKWKQNKIECNKKLLNKDKENMIDLNKWI